ncbi:MAG: patatin-like phospholipase family protein [Trueperaceae bacterium]
MSTHPSTSCQVGLALSGGGARCFAQIGALVALEEEGLQACAIAANSSAAIIGALYAAGNAATAVQSIVRSIDFSTFLDPGGAGGLIEHDEVERILELHAPATFEELKVPLAVPAVDIETGELLVYSDGPLRHPVCASNAFPGLFVPVRFEGRHLLDGGILNNFPIDVARAMTRRPIIAIDVRPPHTGPLGLKEHAPDTLVQKVTAMFDGDGPSVADILMRAYSITQARLLEVLIAMHPPDVWLTPDLPDDLDVQSFDRLDDAFASGYACVKGAADDGRLEALRSVDAG